MHEYLGLSMLVTLHALPLSCMEPHILGLSEGFQAAGKHWLAHGQRLLPAFLTGSCLTCGACSFLLRLKQMLQVTMPARISASCNNAILKAAGPDAICGPPDHVR